jgi:ribulose bisphosphate carboxylase small subunit
MNVMAEVIWTNSNLPESRVINRGMGIRIIAADAADIRYISEIIVQHPAVSLPDENADQEEKASSS